ncbi:hypothetical protein KAR52_02785 [Candidatus Pacearchaeota archaeon]|nr:hypothetical protein [Candidatus Pacearchaeota archaeon]
MNKKRIVDNLEYEVERLLNKPIKHNKMKYFFEQSKSVLGKIKYSATVGVCLTAMALSGFHTIKPNEYLQLHINELGYRGLIGERAEVVEYEDKGISLSKDTKLFWFIPRPFVNIRKIDRNKNYDVEVFYPVREYAPTGPYSKARNFWAGDYGRGYEGINFNVEFKVKENWKNLDADGKGELRLEQLLGIVIQEHIESRKKEFGERLYKQEGNIDRMKLIGHMSKMFKEQKFEDKISLLVYPSPFLRLSYGSTYERYSQGFDYLKSRIEEMGKGVNNFYDEEDAWMLYLNDFNDFVEREDERVKGQVEIEVNDMRSNPLEFKSLISDIEKNYGELMKKYPELVANLSAYARQDYMLGLTMDKIKETYEQGGEDFLTEGLLEKLKTDKGLSNLIEINKVEKSIKSFSGIKLNNHIKRIDGLL